MRARLNSLPSFVLVSLALACGVATITVLSRRSLGPSWLRPVAPAARAPRVAPKPTLTGTVGVDPDQALPAQQDPEGPPFTAAMETR